MVNNRPRWPVITPPARPFDEFQAGFLIDLAEAPHMMTERQVWLAAMKMIQRYGRDAILEAGDRADALLNEGDAEGSDDWQRIMMAVSQLQARKPPPGERVQ